MEDYRAVGKTEASPPIQKMMLQEILFGTWVPPEATSSHVHRIGFSNGNHYVPPVKRVYTSAKEEKDPNKLTGSKLVIFKILKNQVKPVPASVIEKKSKFTRNHCSIIMAELHKMGMLDRKKIHANGTRYYVYEIKK